MEEGEEEREVKREREIGEKCNEREKKKVESERQMK